MSSPSGTLLNAYFVKYDLYKIRAIALGGVVGVAVGNAPYKIYYLCGQTTNRLKPATSNA